MIENDAETLPDQGEHFNCQHDPKWDGDGTKSVLCTALRIPQPRYRVGGKNPRNIYDTTRDGIDGHIGVMFDPADGPRVVAALNEVERRAAAEHWAPEVTESGK